METQGYAKYGKYGKYDKDVWWYIAPLNQYSIVK